MPKLLRKFSDIIIELPWKAESRLNQSGLAFCFLPLPIHTSLPIHIHGYFAVSDNRRSIKWPGHDENSAEALWNQMLIRKMIAPAYSILLSSQCALFTYKDSPASVGNLPSNVFSDAYSSWPLYIEIKNAHMWLEVLEPLLSNIKDSRVLWSTACGGKWVNFTEAYFIYAKNSPPAIVIDTLLKAGLSITLLPDSVYETIIMLKSLNEILMKRVISPQLLRKNFPNGIKLSPEEVYTLLEYALSDLTVYNCSEIYNISLLPLSDGSCCKITEQGSSDTKYLLTDSLLQCYRTFLPGIERLLVDTAMPSSLVKHVKRIAEQKWTQVKIADSHDVCRHLLKVSISTWLPLDNKCSEYNWHLGKGGINWLKNVWKWIRNENIVLADLADLPIVPNYKQNKLMRVTTNVHFFRVQPHQWCSLFENLGFMVVSDSITRSFFPYLNQGNVLDIHNTSIHHFSDQDKDLLRLFFSQYDKKYTKKQAESLRKLPIFREGSSSKTNFVALSDDCFLLPKNIVWPDDLQCPKGMLCKDDLQSVSLIQSLGIEPLAFTDFCIGRLIPLVDCLIGHNSSNGDEIMLWLLRQLLDKRNCNEDLFICLRKKKLIRTKAGKYEKAELLYSNNDREFVILLNNTAALIPDKIYHPYISQLKEIGLKQWIDVERNREDLRSILMESMKSCHSLADRDSMVKRGQFILNQLFAKENCVLTKEDITSLSKVHFLLALKCPAEEYPRELKWSADARSFYSIQSLFTFSKEIPYLIGAIHPIISREYQVRGTYVNMYFNTLKEHDVRSQLKLVESLHLGPEDEQKVTNIVHYIYDNLSKVKDAKKLNKIWSPFLPQPQFLDSSWFVLSVPFELSPYIYDLKLFKNFHSLWNIKNFEISNALCVLGKLKDTCEKQCRKLTDSELDMSAKLIIWLYKQKCDVKNYEVLFPTNDRELIVSHSCVYDDREWFRNSTFASSFKEKAFKYVDLERITPAVAKYFGVKPLSHEVAPSSKLTIEYSRSGQHESITNRIARIVEDYESDIDIFKELIQNADDAQATEIKFLINWQRYPHLSLFSRELKPWQGPALYVYNNATFSDSDFENICKVAGETKRNDPMKTGRFGVGFCATYNVTDLPSFISREYLTIFDPHTRYLGDRITPQHPGMRINLVKSSSDLKHYGDQFKPYDNVFGCDIFNLTGSGYNGTLFRFPFRDSGTSKSSEISDKIYSKEKVKSLVSTLMNMAHELILFQKHINDISLFEIKESSSDGMKKLFSISRNCDDVNRRIKLFNSIWPTGQSNNCSTRCEVSVYDGKECKKSNWIICSLLQRTDHSEELLKKIGTKGMLPFGEIALQVSQNRTPKHPIKVKGKIFCFLPLPITTGLDFHVNGHFIVSKDRRNIPIHDSSSLGAQWNIFLSTKVLNQVFMDMLTAFIGNIDCDMKLRTVEERKEILQSYYNLWRFSDSLLESIAPKMIQAIKHLLPCINYDLLWSESNGGMWLSAKDAILFSEEGKHNTVLADVTDVLLTLNYKLVQIPFHVTKLIKDIVKSKNHEYSYERFITEILFPHIDETKFKDIWERNLSYILRGMQACYYSYGGEFGWAKKQLSSKPCILCQESSSLMNANDVIDCTNTLLAQLYEMSEGKFPIQTLLESPQAKSALQSLGMSSHNLSKEQLIDRAQSVKRLPLESALDRSNKILDYIDGIYYRSTSYMPRSLPSLKSLSDIDFLPVLKRPECIELPWFGDGTNFSSPSKVHAKSQACLVFTVANITSAERHLSHLLDVRSVPTIEMVMQHLSNLVEAASDREINEETKKYLDEAMINLYGYIDKWLEKHNESSILDKDNKSSILKLKAITNPIWQDGTFKPVCRVVAKCDATCDPYIARLSENYCKYSYLFFKVLGVTSELTLPMMLEILKDIQDDYAPGELTDEVLKFVVRIASNLASKMNSDESHQIFLPDERRVMRPVSQLACDNFDSDWIKALPTYKEHFETESGFFIHSSIPRDTAIKLGVYPLLDAVIQGIEDDDFLKGSDYGQHEDLCDRLNGILRKYPADTSILQEFIQNADDAKASEIVFILDCRTNYPDEKLLCSNKNWKSLQHMPALCIVNNRKFREEDIKGISHLGRGTKAESKKTIGKFGMGFNVVYHVTDCPSFLSCGKGGIPENLCVFDPTLSFVSASRKSPGRKWTLGPKYTSDFCDQLKPYLLNDISTFPSTVLSDIADTGCVVFRLPLTKQKKLFYSKKFSIRDIENLFGTFRGSSKEVLLFLNNIKSISAIKITEDGKIVHCFTTSSIVPSVYTDVYSKFVHESEQCVEELICGKIPKSCSLFHRLDIQHVFTESAADDPQDNGATTLQSTDSWLIQKVMCGKFSSEKLQIAIKHNLRPVGGVATLLNPDNRKYGYFCYIPMPIKTNLPVHINGHFVVDDSRKHLENIHGQGEELVQLQWNKELVENVITSAYSELIINAKEYLLTLPNHSHTDIEKFIYHLFPNTSDKSGDVDNITNLISKTIYNKMLECDLPLFLIKGQEMHWKSLRNFVFVGKTPSIEKRILKILLSLGMNIVDASHILEGFLLVDSHMPCLHYSTVRSFLETVDVSNEGIKNILRDNVQYLIKFCITDIKQKKVVNVLSYLPLLLAADGSLQKRRQMYSSSSLPFLPDCSDRIIDKSLECSPIGNYLKTCKVIVLPDLRVIAENIGIPDSNVPCVLDKNSSERISLLWSFLHNYANDLRDFDSIFKFKPILPTVGAEGKMYPMCLSKAVVSSARIDGSTRGLLLKLGYSELDTSIITNKSPLSLIMDQFIFSRNADFLPCFQLGAPHKYDVDLDTDEINLIIRSLCDGNNINQLPAISPVLRKLKLYMHADGKTYVSLERVNDIYIIPNNVPVSGLDLVQEKLSTETLLKMPPDNTKYAREFYQNVMNFSTASIDPVQLYCRFIIPNICLMEEFQILHHIDYIQANLKEESAVSIYQELKQTPFVHCNGKMRLVKNLYDPENEFFKVFRSDLFPGSVWRTRLPFLRKLGLCCKVTMEEWIFQAKEFSTLLKRCGIKNVLICC